MIIQMVKVVVENSVDYVHFINLIGITCSCVNYMFVRHYSETEGHTLFCVGCNNPSDIFLVLHVITF